MQRGHNRQPTFFAAEDYHTYLHHLAEGARRYGCQIHAYVLMTNHVHVLVTPESRDALAALMRYVGSRYVQYVNYVYRRRGTLWEGRFKSSLVQAEDYLLACYRYIELNPVRAAMVERPEHYRWSSYACHALAKVDALVTDHLIYVELGATQDARCAAYRELYRYELDAEIVGEIRGTLNKGLALGAKRFKDAIEQALARSVREKPRGRRRKTASEIDGEHGQFGFAEERK
ncbi:MAG: transposase [Sulfuricaulis sp.]|uniref:transposase n=1 Tax=Sulfuricaulis sp. TaxID=2003553 RepID=UPI0034A3FE7C